PGVFEDTTGGTFVLTSVRSSATFAAESSKPTILCCRDFSGDKKSDILWRNSTSGTVYEWLMNGVSVSNQGSLGVVSSDWQIGGFVDFSGDSSAVILWRSASGEVYLWLMNGTSISSHGSLGVVSSDWQIAGVGDFNSDGTADILWRNNSGEVYLWLMNGTSIS